jgi:N-acetylneuraminic acid mutarotase
MCGVAKGRIVVFGGTNWEDGKKKWLQAIRVFDPAASSWSTLADMSCQRAYGLCIQDDQALALVGGSNDRSTIRYLETYDGACLGVTKDLDLPRSIVLSAGGRIGMKDYIVGGTDDAANLAGMTAATHVIAGSEVSRLADYPGKSFAVAASAVVGDEMFVFGGMNYDEATKAPANSTAAYAFSPAKNTWRKLQPLPVANRGLAAVVLDEQHIYLAGGYTDNFTADAVIYDVKTDSYQKAKSLPYAAMVGLVKLGDSVYCLGGEDKQKSRTNKFFRIPTAELK